MRRLLIACLGCLAMLATTAPARSQEAGDEWTEPITGMEFVWVPGGCYEMGCGEWAGDDCDEDEFPVHEVCVDGFWMGKYEVTLEQWLIVMSSNSVAYELDQRAKLPIGYIFLENSQLYIEQLNNTSSALGESYRLPTEAEWEYACRSGGQQEKFSGSNDVDSVAWQYENSDGYSHPVGNKLPNGLGIYDMSGNVAELVQDYYSAEAYNYHSWLNPINDEIAFQYVVRGGSWDMGSPLATCGARSAVNKIHYDVGFRLIRIN